MSNALCDRFVGCFASRGMVCCCIFDLPFDRRAQSRLGDRARGTGVVARGAKSAACLLVPTSVAAPYEPMNAWRIIHMHLAAFSLALGLWAGINRRRSALFVPWAFVLSAFAMAVVAIVQDIDEAERVLWLLDSENPHFWGSFFYRNQGVAFLPQLDDCRCGCALFFHSRHSRNIGRSGDPISWCNVSCRSHWGFGSSSLSRGGILFGAVILGVFIVFIAVDFLVGAAHLPLSRTLPISLMLLCLIGGGLYQGAN